MKGTLNTQKAEDTLKTWNQSQLMQKLKDLGDNDFLENINSRSRPNEFLCARIIWLLKSKKLDNSALFQTMTLPQNSPNPRISGKKRPLNELSTSSNGRRQTLDPSFFSRHNLNKDKQNKNEGNDNEEIDSNPSKRVSLNFVFFFPPPDSIYLYDF
ncbi:hypothetical protein RFI_23573 [Reticulomyxa filosa]|uniref:Uncharacterized protein n=1 Tax=Reticulomyxa filosa TaxID=46433 RepID=X6MIU2_RETFI|nr:hypothetical protein RFI_23573 [Reticulomyxa filosa]|eukprot:ETO13794.1 hypothetical protein RFI_23573 [Reticulomyxa filosa]